LFHERFRLALAIGTIVEVTIDGNAYSAINNGDDARILAEDTEKLLLEAVEGRRLKLSDKHPRTLESINNLIDLYEAWNKLEKAEEWRAKLLQA